MIQRGLKMPNNLDMLTFSEADKSSHKAFDKDATGVIWAVKNREARPERFGNTRDEVIFAPSQFSGVNSDEWKKVESGNLTKDEEWYYKRGAQLRRAIDDGKIADPTGGADHYYNPSLASPDWAEAYDKTYSSGAHDYHKEITGTNKKGLDFKQAFYTARINGRKTFTWNGKKYTTKLKTAK